MTQRTERGAPGFPTNALETRSRPIRAREQAGFTLAELIITLAIAGILAAFGRVLGDVLKRAQATTISNQLVAHLHLARTFAINRNTRITLCQSNDGVHCGPEHDWRNGWMVFTDPNNNRVVDNGEEILRVQQKLGTGYRLFWRGSLGTNNFLSFYPSGLSSKAGTFSLCSSNSSIPPRAIVISRTGQVRSSHLNGKGKRPECSG